MVDRTSVGRNSFQVSYSGNNITNAERTGGTLEGPLAQTQASRPLASTQDVFEKPAEASKTNLGEGSNIKFNRPVEATTKNSPSNRSAANYIAVIEQFKVETNPRYDKAHQKVGSTYCSTFVWDVTKAMGAEIPYWQDKDGNPVDVPADAERPPKEATATPANGMCDWLEKHGERNGWKKVETEAEAQAAANEGKLTVAASKKEKGSGHVGIVRPGEVHKVNGPALAQAGSRNFENRHVKNGFADLPVTYWVHNPSVAAQ